MQRISKTAIPLMGALIAFPSLAFAGGGACVPAAPLPIAGVGLPALVIGVVGYWLIRKMRDGRTG